MIYEVSGNKAKSQNFQFYCWLIGSILLFLGCLVYLFCGKNNLNEEDLEPTFVMRTWEDSIPSDIPQDKVVLLSHYINNPEKFNLEVGYGPLGVKEVDFNVIAPKYFENPNIEEESQSLSVAYYILRSINSYYNDWESTFVCYVYGDYVLNSERPQDIERRNSLLSYLGY